MPFPGVFCHFIEDTAGPHHANAVCFQTQASLALHLNQQVFHEDRATTFHGLVGLCRKGFTPKQLLALGKLEASPKSCLPRSIINCNTPNVHRDDFLLLLFFFFKLSVQGMFSRHTAGNCSENWPGNGETPVSEHYVLVNFPLARRIRVSESLWNAPLLLMILHDRYVLFNIYSFAFSNIKKGSLSTRVTYWTFNSPAGL